MVSRLDLLGQRFGRLLVVATANDYIQPSGQKKSQWNCKCDCGTEVIVRTGDLRSGHTSSCSCLNRELITKALTKHGCNRRGRQTINYRLWFSIKQRCCDPKYKRYSDYGGRGINMHPIWQTDFKKFDSYINEFLGPRPEGLTLDRVNNDIGYVPGNLRWATYKQQNNNRRSRRKKENYET